MPLVIPSKVLALGCKEVQLLHYSCFPPPPFPTIVRVQLLTLPYILALRNFCFKVSGYLGSTDTDTLAPRSRAKASAGGIMPVSFSFRSCICQFTVQFHTFHGTEMLYTSFSKHIRWYLYWDTWFQCSTKCSLQFILITSHSSISA